jgi:hypothetical protein
MEKEKMIQEIHEVLDRTETAVQDLIDAKVSNAKLMERNRILGYLVGWGVTLNPSQIQQLTLLGEDD